MGRVHEPTVETLFAAFRENGDADALAAVFDRLAPKLLLVAAHLAGGSAAEDVVQATFVDAMRQRQRWDAARPLAPWLLGLLGNHVREARRQRRRVPDERRLAARAVTLPDDEAAANEAFAAVARAVDTLPRHYRQVLSLRLVHGLELQQIAHSLDVPLGTVKVRLHRGLALLRRALPAGLTASFALLATPSLGLATARQAVLAEAAAAANATAAAGSAVLATAITLGGLGMKKVMLGIGAAALAAAGWFAIDAARAEPSPTAAASTATAAAVDGSAEPAPPPAAASAHAAAQIARAEADGGRSAPPATGSLTVEVVWASDGTPAPFVSASAARLEPDGARTDGGMREVDRTAPECSDAAGRVVFAGLAPGTYACRFGEDVIQENEHRARTEVRAGDTATLRCEIGGDVRIRVAVVDAAGTPRAAAAVWCRDDRAEDEMLRPLGPTDRTGTLEYRGLPIRALWARAAGVQPSMVHELPPWASTELPKTPVEVRLQLGTDGCTLTGVVLAPDGRAAAGARVAFACDDTLASLAAGAFRCELLATADEAGRFRCDEVPAGERFVAASLPGSAPALQRVVTTVNAPTAVVLTLRRGAVLTGRVTKDVGAAAGGVMVSIGPARSVVGLTTPFGQHRWTRTDADGHYRIDAILPGANAARVETMPVIEHQLELADGENATWNPTLAAPRAITGVVLGPDDRPLAGWRLEAMPHAIGSNRYGLLSRGTTTGGDGRFRLGGLDDAAYRLLAYAPVIDGDSAAVHVPRASVAEARPSPEPLTIRVDAAALAGGWIEGSVVLPDGVQAAAEISLHPKGIHGRGGFPVPQQRFAKGATTFRLGPLPPNDYDVLCAVEGRAQLAQRGVRVAADATVQLAPFRFDLQRPQVFVLRHADGRPATGGTVQLRSDLAACRETAPGRYESAPTVEGDDELLVRGPDFAPAVFPIARNPGTAPIERTVAPATPVTVRLKPPSPRQRWVGALRVRLRDAAGTAVVSDLVQIDCGEEFRWRIGLPPGTYSLALAVSRDGAVDTTLTVGATPFEVELQLAK
jgi:RNA polymerase sigma factor (sigma-70 family)